MKKYPPTNINSVVGYRTKSSSISQEAWDFAQKMLGDIWVKFGWISLAVSVALSISYFYLRENVVVLMR